MSSRYVSCTKSELIEYYRSLLPRSNMRLELGDLEFGYFERVINDKGSIIKYNIESIYRNSSDLGFIGLLRIGYTHLGSFDVPEHELNRMKLNDISMHVDPDLIGSNKIFELKYDLDPYKNPQTKYLLALDSEGAQNKLRLILNDPHSLVIRSVVQS